MINNGLNFNLATERLLADDHYVLEVLETLLAAQDEDERNQRETKRENFRGFNKPDARRFTKMAEDGHARGYLTPEELAKCRKLDKRGRPALAKYRRQFPPLNKKPTIVEFPRRIPQHETTYIDVKDQAS